MSLLDKLLPQNISERSFQAVVLILLGGILLIIGLLEKIDKLGIKSSPDFTLRIITVCSGVFLIIFGCYHLVKRENNNKTEERLSVLENITINIESKIQDISWLHIQESVSKIFTLENEINTLKRKVELLNISINFPSNQNVATVSNGRAFLIMEKCIDCADKPPKPEIMDALSNASPEARNIIFETIKSYRKNMVHKLLQLKIEEEKSSIRTKIAHLAILLESIAEIEQKKCDQNLTYLHEIFINIAYVYKDSHAPDWDRALKFIKLAIEKRNNGEFDRRFYVDYEINRMLCNINLQKCGSEKCGDINNDFNWIWSFEDGRNRIMNVPPMIFPNFYEWMAKYKMKNITEWLVQHPDKQDDWFNMFDSEKFKENVRKYI